MITVTSSLGIFLRSSSEFGKEVELPSCLRDSFLTHEVSADNARMSALKEWNQSESAEFEDFMELSASLEEPPTMGEEINNLFANHGFDDDEALAYAQSMIEFWAPGPLRSICNQLSIESSCFYECLLQPLGWKIGRMFTELLDEDEDEECSAGIDLEVLLGIGLALDVDELAFDLGCEAGVDVDENTLEQIKAVISAIREAWGLSE